MMHSIEIETVAPFAADADGPPVGGEASFAGISRCRVEAAGDHHEVIERYFVGRNLVRFHVSEKRKLPHACKTVNLTNPMCGAATIHCSTVCRVDCTRKWGASLQWPIGREGAQNAQD